MGKPTGFMEYARPVSYTHLDVYKRQGHAERNHTVNFPALKFHSDQRRVHGTILKIEVHCNQDSEDVYKRQDHASGQ